MDQDEYNRSMQLEYDKGAHYARGLIDTLQSVGVAMTVQPHPDGGDKMLICLTPEAQ